MIDYINGKLVSKHPTYAVIDVSGVGFGLSIPLSTYARLPAVGADQKLFSWLYVREDAIQLFGFATGEERELFKMLLNVSGVGPRMAAGILSALTPANFLEAVRSGDTAALTSVPGIGRKKAERLLLELKDRVGTETSAPEEAEGGALPATESERAREAVSALVSLGSRYPEASAAVRKAVDLSGPGAGLEEIIKESLKHL